MMTTQEMIDVLEAHKAGKQIEVKLKSSTRPWELETHPSWDFVWCDYRIKPKVAREFWINHLCLVGGWGEYQYFSATVYNKEVQSAIHVREVE